jgi:hypothetical protein
MRSKVPRDLGPARGLEISSTTRFPGSADVILPIKNRGELRVHLVARCRKNHPKMY